MMSQITWFWVISPILDMEKEKQKKQTAEMKLQDEHNCLLLITNQVIKIHEEGGFWTEVMGRHLCVQLWIHFIAGDTSVHNNLVEHMNGGWPKYSSIKTVDVSLMISLAPYQCVLSSHQRNRNKHI
jgi:hypothetical protein